MKRFLTTLLAASILIPSPILANDEMESMDAISSDFEEMNDEELEVISLEETSVVNESSNATCTINFTLNGEIKATSTISLRSGVLTLEDQALAFQNIKKQLPQSEYGYGFAKEPGQSTAPSGGSCSIELQKLTFEQIANAVTFDTDVPITLEYSLKDASSPSNFIKFDKWDDVAKGSTTITKEKINEKLASSGYATKNGVAQKDLTPIYYCSSQKVVPFYYLLKSNDLEKVKVSNLLNNPIQVTFSTSPAPIQCTFLVKDLNPNSETGEIKLTAETLQNALNQMSIRSGDKVSFKVKNNGPETIQTLSVYNLNNLNVNSNFLEITMDFSSSTSGFILEIHGPESNDPVLLQRYVTLSEIDTNGKTNGEVVGKISPAEMEKFIANNYKKLKYVAAGFSEIDLTNIDFLKDGLTPIRQVRVGYQEGLVLDSLFQETFTLKFVDSTQGQVVDTTSKPWHKLFKGTSLVTLTKNLVAGDVLPSGYGIALVQKPKSTALSKKELGKNETDGDFAISVYGPNEVTIYVTKREGVTSTDKNDGHIATKPTTPEPTQPVVPVVPEQPQQPTSISSQGRQTMFRLYNSQTHEHFYTRSAEEKAKLMAEGNWNDEGHGWNAPAVSSYVVYRLFNPNSGEHHYTKDKNEYDTLIRYGWNGEGHAFYSADDATNKVTIYRLYNSNAPEVAQHHYTTSEKERDQLIQDGWKSEGTAWFGMPAE